MNGAAADHRAELAQQIAEQLRQLGPQIEVALGDEQIVVEQNGVMRSFALAEIEAAYRRAPDELAVIVANLLSALAAPPPQRAIRNFDALQQRIFPMLKSALLVQEAQQRGLPAPVYRPFPAGLIITYVVEEPQRLVYLNEEHLEQWQIGEHQLYDAALPNLRRRTAERSRFSIGGDEEQPLIVAAGGDGFDAARILLPELLDSWQRHMPGRLLLAIPTRDLLLAFSDVDPTVVEQIAEQAARDAAGTNGLSDQLFVWEDGELRVYAWE